MHDQARKVIAPPLPVLAVALGVMGMLCGCGAPANPAAASQSGPDPAITVANARELIEAIERTNAADVVVLNFWATWCPPCVAEMPAFVRFQTEFAARPVKVISVSADHPDTLADRVRPFVQKHKLPFPVRVLSERDPTSIASALELDWNGALPATFVLDKGGRVAKAWLEEVRYDDLAAAVSVLLAH